MKKQKLWLLLAAISLLAGVTACSGQKGAEPAGSAAEEKEAEVGAETEEEGETGSSGIVVDAAILVQGYEWGPGVPKIILELDQEVSKVDAKNWTVVTADQERVVKDVYICDESGEKTDTVSGHVAVEMETTYENPGSPFTYDKTVGMNKWKESYEISVECTDFTIDEKTEAVTFSADCMDKIICPDTERFSERDSFTGSYKNPFTGTEEELTLYYAAYEPETLSEGEKNPLVIWLHGMGEGGNDPDIAILGNEVSALTREKIQSHFSAGDQTGAYVLVVQTETYWMNEGDTNGGITGSGDSLYQEILMDTIQSYVKSNPDVDANRIYLGGCSNGGYMTMNMMIHYPDYFAAGYPCCEGYSYYACERNEDGTCKFTEDGAAIFGSERWLTEEKVNTIKDLPFWFISSIDDTMAVPQQYVLPSYQALIQAGAENCWLSMFENVKGTDDPDASYIGHFSWVYLLNDQVTGVQDKEAVRNSEDSELFGTTPSNEGGGTLKAGEYANIFEWMNQQSRQ